MTENIKNDFYEKVPKLVNGYFKIQVEDLDGNILQEHEEHNKVLVWVHQMFSNLVFGYEPNLSAIDDFRIHAFAIGTDGVDSEGIPKKIENDREQLYSEENFWKMNYYLGENAYVYQVTFDKPQTEDLSFVYKLNEGTTFPQDGGVPKNYRGPAYNDETELEASVTIKRSFQNGILTNDIYIGKLAGNGHPMWDEPAKFSEAAFYMTVGTNETTGDPLGTIFSMKTFPEMPKSEQCVIRINWTMDFNI